MSPQHIEIAALQWAAMHDRQAAEDTMTSPYLDYVRSTRDIIEALLATRELELAKTTVAARRRRIERELAFLREELARTDGRQVERTAGSNKGASLRHERSRR